VTRLSTRTLTRTLWVRQQLVPGQRSVRGTEPMVEHLLGLQAQEGLPPYLSLAARLDEFTPTDLSARLEDRSLVRLFSLRGTVHVLTPSDALTLRAWVQPALDRVSGSNEISRPAGHLSTGELDAVVGPFLGDDARPHTEIGQALAAAYPDVPEAALRHVSRERLPLVQVPPRGLWKRSGGVVYAYADRYLGRPFAKPDVEALVLRYLAAYGPATAADMTKWSMVTRLGPVFAAMAKAGRLTTYVDESGRTLYDAPDAPVAADDLELPVLLLGRYDNLFLSHADRDRIAPDHTRKAWMGANGGVGSTLFLDGLLAGLWRVEDDRAVVEPFRPLTKAEQQGLDAEIARVETLLAMPA
jgi:hypothetical protein